jgi:hypothetical protein
MFDDGECHTRNDGSTADSAGRRRGGWEFFVFSGIGKMKIREWLLAHRSRWRPERPLQAGGLPYFFHHTRHGSAETIGSPTLHENAS